MEAFIMFVATKLEEIRFGKQCEPKLLMLSEIKSWAFWRAVLAELVGTLLFVFLGCASALAFSGAHSHLHIALAFGLSIMMLIQMFGHVSGGHFNPSVSVGMAVGMIISPLRAVMYVIAQTVGAIVGGMLLKGISPSITHSNLGVTKLSSELNPGQGVGIEIILTFCLVFTIISTTDSNRTDFGSVSVKIGLTVATLHLSGISFTGASMNPARSLGSAIASGYYTHHWLYWVGPLAGGCLAAVIYKFLFNPYRGVMSTDEAVQKLLSDGNLVTIPRDYFKNDPNTDRVEKMDTMKL